LTAAEYFSGVSVVLSNHSVSLDGFIARPDGKPGRLHEWLDAGDPQSRSVVADLRARIGATIVGRKTYEDSDWGDQAPFDSPVFVVTHAPPDDAEALPFVFVTEGVAHAVELAKEAAGSKDVALLGGDVTRQALSAGLLDELHLNLVPVLYGEGVRFLDDFEGGPVRLERTRLIDAPRASHVSFRVLRD
jgi:dihydrofolate reductase